MRAFLRFYIYAFTWRVLLGMTEKEKDKERRMQKSKRNGRFGNKIFKFRETSDEHTRTHTHGTTRTSAILIWSDVCFAVCGIRMQSENEMSVCVSLNVGQIHIGWSLFSLFFCFVSTLCTSAPSVIRNWLVCITG